MKKAAQLAKLLSIAFFLLLVGAIIVGIVAWALTPRYNGKTVQHWFALAEKQFTGNLSRREMDAIENAFQEMGADALPFLLEKFTLPHSVENIRRAELLFKIQNTRWIPQSIKDLLPNPFTGNEQNTAQQLLSAMARRGIFAQRELEQILLRPGPLGGYLDFQVYQLFEQMGEKASNSSPVIARAFASTNGTYHPSALQAFVAITPVDSPHATLLRDAVAGGTIRAAIALPHFAKWRLPLEPFLSSLGEELCSTNGAIHGEAMSTVKRIHLHQQVLLPYFPKAINDPDPRFRADLLKELRILRTNATPATRQVLLTLDDSYSYVRVEAIKTLHAIHPKLADQPEVLAKLKSKLTDPNEHVRETAHAALTFSASTASDRSPKLP
jgi:hypothetical protein